MGNDIGTGRTEGMEPIKSSYLLTFLVSNTLFFNHHNKMVQNWRFLYIKKFQINEKSN